MSCAETGTDSGGKSSNHEKMLPLRMISKVARGFGRGSTDLGIPTANLDRSSLKLSKGVSFNDLECGIYWGFCRIGEDTDKNSSCNGSTDNESSLPRSSSLGVVYKTAISIGYNPTYGNKEKTVEPHLIAPPTDSRRHASSCGETLFGQFYDQQIRLSVVGYLRPELPFEGLEKLVEAIKQDIVDTEKLCDSDVPAVLKEEEWVVSSQDI